MNICNLLPVVSMRRFTSKAMIIIDNISEKIQTDSNKTNSEGFCQKHTNNNLDIINQTVVFNKETETHRRHRRLVR